MPVGDSLIGWAPFCLMKVVGYTIKQWAGYSPTPTNQVIFGFGHRNTTGFGQRKESTPSYTATTHRTGYIYWALKTEKPSTMITQLVPSNKSCIPCLFVLSLENRMLLDTIKGTFLPSRLAEFCMDLHPSKSKRSIETIINIQLNQYS